MTVRVKVCGLRRREDAEHAASLGADFLGFVFAPSPRRVDVDELRTWLPELKRRHGGSALVGVFSWAQAAEAMAAADALSLDYLQFHGPRPADGALPSFKVPVILSIGSESLDTVAAKVDGRFWAYLADTPTQDGQGGTGRVHDWARLPRPPRTYRLFLAGGLDAENVAEAIRQVEPFAVDAASRLEAAPGMKDWKKVEAYVAAARSASGRTHPSGRSQ